MICEYDKMSCLKIKTIKPLKHQQEICKFLMKESPSNKGILVFHSVGSGKTITSLLAANCLLKKYPSKNVIVTTGKSLVNNFEKEIKKLELDNKKIAITSYGEFVNRIKKGVNSICKNNILIIDEAHNFGRKGVRSDYLIKCALKAFKVILLTATPVKNNPEEITNLMAMISGKSPNNLRSKVKEALQNQTSNMFKNLFRCKVSFFNTQDTTNYPSSKEHIIKLIMSPDYYKEYYKIQEDIKGDLPELFRNTKNLLTFLNGARRAVNKTNVVSPKITWTIKKIIDDISEDKKVLIYSSWKQAGINIIKDFLRNNNISFGEISGELSKIKRDKFVSEFNKDKIKVILVTAAGSEGLDLKGTRSIIILEPHWNEARLQQIIGRGIRYGSHSHLPVNKRHVDLYYLILDKPNKTYIGDNIPSADVILRKLSLFKSGEIMEFYKNLEKISIEKNKSCFK